MTSTEEVVPQPPPPDPHENLIFHAKVRGQKVCFDPWRVGRVLAATLEGESVWDVMGRAYAEDNPLAPRSMDKLLAAVDAAFGTQGLAVNGTGLTECERLRLLTEFVDWQQGVKRFFGSGRLWRVSPAPESPSPEEPRPPSNATASG